MLVKKEEAASEGRSASRKGQGTRALARVPGLVLYIKEKTSSSYVVRRGGSLRPVLTYYKVSSRQKRTEEAEKKKAARKLRVRVIQP